MSTVPKFTFEGRNGALPFCLEKIDVSGWAFVEPLTLEQACKIWWSMETATVDIDGTPVVIDIKAGDYTVPPDPLYSYEFDSQGKLPNQRVCGKVGMRYRNFFGMSMPNAGAAFVRNMWVSGPPMYDEEYRKPCALYDGDVTVEANLIGYGWVAPNSDGLRPFAHFLHLSGESPDPYRVAEEHYFNAGGDGGSFFGAIDTVVIGGITWYRQWYHEYDWIPETAPYNIWNDITYFDFA